MIRPSTASSPIASRLQALSPTAPANPASTPAKLNQFFADLQAYSDWWKSAEDNSAAVWPMGDATAAAYAAFDAVDGKIDDYFARTRLAGYDSRAQAALNRHETEYLTIAAKDMAITADEVAGFPLSRIVANQPLSLRAALNPAWVAAMTALLIWWSSPILGDRTILNEAD